MKKKNFLLNILTMIFFNHLFILKHKNFLLLFSEKSLEGMIDAIQCKMNEKEKQLNCTFQLKTLIARLCCNLTV